MKEPAQVFELSGTLPATVTISDEAIGSALLARARDLVLVSDDGGMDWMTDGAGNTYVGSAEWWVSSNPAIAALVDAGNVLRGHRLVRVGTPAGRPCCDSSRGCAKVTGMRPCLVPGRCAG